MKKPAAAFVLIIACVILAGCTQSQPASVPQPEVTRLAETQPVATQPVEVLSPTPAATKAPAATVTVIRYVTADKRWKDANLQIAFTTPDTWSVTTRQVDLPEGSQGLEYRTDLVAGDKFFIMTFPISRNQDQDYRNIFRKWAPAPDESTVTIGNVVFDRFESTGNGTTKVGYVARKSSANDIGYSSVMYFIADGSTPFEKDDFEKVVQSFVYLTRANAATSAGYDIPRIR